MKRFVLLTAILFAAALVWTDSAQAQTPSGHSVVIETPRGLRYLVDGQMYESSTTFLWATGTTHTLSYPVSPLDGFQYGKDGDTRYLPGGWRVNGSITQVGGANTVSLTAGPDLTRVIASVGTEYRLRVRFFEDQPVYTLAESACSQSVRNNQPPGAVYVGAICYSQNVDIWQVSGLFLMQAYAYPGYSFLGWSLNNAPLQATPSGQFNLLGPTTVYARFTSAKRVKFRTEPAGLYVRVNRTEVRTTSIEPCEANNYQPVPDGAGTQAAARRPCVGEFDFAPGNKVFLGGVSPQIDRYGKVWVLDKFSNGATADWVYTVPQEIYPDETITATYVPGIKLSFPTQPAGLKIKVNGRDNWPENYFVAAAGTKHTLEAPLEQTDARGRKWAFKKWSNGGARTQEITIPADAELGNVVVAAEFELLSQLTIRSNPAGATVRVDGSPCATPCRVDRRDGTEAVVEAPLSSELSDVHRFEFASWSNGGDREQPVKISGADGTTLTANFTTAYKLALAGDPADGVRFDVSGATPENFYTAGSTITVTAQDRPGYRFRRWEIDAEGTSRTVTLTMGRPRTLLARMEKLPFQPLSALKNAAGETPEDVVAPGSLVAIYGENLAGYYEAGPTGPILSQALAGVSAVVGNRILPLLFVSPTQINAQLPRDLAPGEHQIRVIRAGSQDAVGTFNVVVRAPGLFSQPVDNQPFALARHADGSLVTLESPARPGETITLLATGFGPYQAPILEGMAVPPGPGYSIGGPVSLQAGDLTPEVVYAGGVAGQIGLDQIQFRLPGEFPANMPEALRVKVTLDGRESNTVLLPIAPAATVEKQ
ncbi:MAG: PEGA domain-containing protein [Bryobacterales bacterium]|nr:PEGA domain-containing protein [Bryobacterales bacterium]